jgi:hypothetical protein
VHLLTLQILPIVVVILGMAGWLVFKFWRDKAPSSRPADPEVNVKAELQVSRTHGWTFFNLVLENRSRMRVAVVDATFTISGLVAKFQAGPAARETTFKIRRTVVPGGILGAGLVEYFYNAAGRPQSGYSFLVATTVRYRAHGDLFEQALPLYRVTMVALSPNDLRRIRWYHKPEEPTGVVQHLPELDPADQQWLDAESGRAA